MARTPTCNSCLGCAAPKRRPLPPAAMIAVTCIGVHGNYIGTRELGIRDSGFARRDSRWAVPDSECGIRRAGAATRVELVACAREAPDQPPSGQVVRPN